MNLIFPFLFFHFHTSKQGAHLRLNVFVCHAAKASEKNHVLPYGELIVHHVMLGAHPQGRANPVHVIEDGHSRYPNITIAWLQNPRDYVNRSCLNKM